jgi:hypothetical protein
MNVNVSFSTGYKMMSVSSFLFHVVFPLNTPNLFYFYRNFIRGCHYWKELAVCPKTILLFLKRENHEFVIAYVLLGC